MTVTKRLNAFLIENPDDLSDAELSTLTGVPGSRIRDIRLQNDRAERQKLFRSAAHAIGTSPKD